MQKTTEVLNAQDDNWIMSGEGDLVSWRLIKAMETKKMAMETRKQMLNIQKLKTGTSRQKEYQNKSP